MHKSTDLVQVPEGERSHKKMDDQSVIFCFFLGYKRQNELKPSTNNSASGYF